MSGDSTVSAFPDGDNLFHWIATIVGGKETAYEGLKFKLSLTFPSRYPYTPPIVKFVTHCYHPNVDNHGNICLDILKVNCLQHKTLLKLRPVPRPLMFFTTLALFLVCTEEKGGQDLRTRLHIMLIQLQEKWSALYDVRTILLSIQSLLAGRQITVSEPDSPPHVRVWF